MVVLSAGPVADIVLVIGRELLLFAAVGIALIGLDDLAFDGLWLWRRLRHGRRLGPGSAEAPGRDLSRQLAMFVPAWREDGVIGPMLAATCARWTDPDVTIYVGLYPNDPATILAASAAAIRDPRVRLVIGPRSGPTTKGDNLNAMWRALLADRAAGAAPVAAVVLHDAEDVVHAGEPALYRRHLAHHAMVQIPVVPLPHPASPWVSGHYCDEFAETHAKDLPLRSALGLGVPSAGVGCAVRFDALSALARARGGMPFSADSLTEDYEMGLALARAGYSTRFVGDGGRDDPVVSRGYFPRHADAAIRQKARWITGIALHGWDRIGWARAAVAGPRGWLDLWMLWRDRRAPVTAVLLLAAYAALILSGAALVLGAEWSAARAVLVPGAALGYLLAFNALLLVWRLVMRVRFTARRHGWVEALRAIPRAFFGNIIAILAARRAVVGYLHATSGTTPRWDKTEHDFPAQGALRPVVAVRGEQRA